ncbi:MAG: toxic anion resistance protein [Eubacteriaceae bacterium]|nr:toxic anion resistance protein [Eubacteriaceae bacterium]
MSAEMRQELQDFAEDLENMPVISLHLDGEEEKKDIPSALELFDEPKETKAEIARPKYSPEEMRVITEFSEKIDITNSSQVLQYGTGAQKNIAQFSEAALTRVRTKDVGEVGNMLSNLVIELKGFSAEEEKGVKGIFQKATNQITKIKARYDKVEVNVDKIVSILEGHQVTLLKDINMFNQMYDKNLQYFKELGMYIEAGKIKLDQVRSEVLPELQKKAEESGLTEDAQIVNDMVNMATQFEKRIHDLELTRMVSIQMGPQIRLVQNNDAMMVDKINSSLMNTIPLWKSQMVLALGFENSKQAMQAQREVTNVTNELLKKNADMLKIGTIEVAKESERGVVDIQTLTYTNERLISTINEVIQIQDNGFKKRREAEIELMRIEGDLREKLREVRRF